MIEKVKEKLKDLPRVLDFDGNFAPEPSQAVKDNIILFLESLSFKNQRSLNVNSGITASPTGSITLDWYKNKSFVSVEISEDKIGFYSELPDGSTPYQYSAEIEDQDFIDTVESCIKALSI